MNKMKKLLSVVLAVVLAFSGLSVLGSAAIAQYKTVDDLRARDAYSPYGQVTRLSTEERASIVQDFLDTLLPGLGINMGTISLAGIISVTLDLSSVDQLCVSLDSIKSVKGNFLFSLAATFVDLGILETLDMDTWNTGIDRAGDSQLTLFSELFELLSNNTALVNEILTDGLDLGIVGGFLGADLGSIGDLVTNLPGLIKGLIYPMIERWDDDLATIKNYDNSIANESLSVEAIANTRIKKLLTDNMSQTTVKYDANGNMTSEHTGMPIVTTAPTTASNSSKRCVYVVNGTTPGSTMTVYHIVDAAEAKALAEDNDDTNNVAAYNYIAQEGEYVLTEEVEGNGVYVWKSFADDGVTVTGTLKYYNDNSPLIPGMSASVINEKVDLTSDSISAGDLLYTFIPYLFEDLAVVVLNGSVKKILGEFFGATYNYVGNVGSDEVNALGNDAIFSEPQGDYVFEWSDYAVIGENHYYRFEDQIFAADLSNTNNYFDIINWEYEFTGDFMNDFVPADDSNVNDRLLLNLNDFLVAVAEKITVASKTTVNKADGETAEWTRPTFQTGSNEYVINNIKAAAQAVISLAPQHIFGSDYADNPRCYYDMFMYENADEATENAVILTGIAAQLVDIIMPSMTLPTSEDLIADETRVGAILAGVIREFAAYLAPEYNFDALIYADFGTTTADKVKTFLAGKDSEYWFDVCMTMGINIGYEYLRAFADMGEGTSQWNSFVAYSGYGVDGKTYAAGTTQAALNAEWEGMLDYIVDWALSTDYEWAWQMNNLVNTTDLTIDLATAQDPFVKLQQILGSILPVDEILTVEPADGETKFEHWLRQDLILGIVDLEWDHLVNTIQFNGTNKYFRSGNVLDQLAALLKSIINPIFKKIGGGSYEFIPSNVTDFDSLAKQAGIKELAVGLVGKLKTAYDNGLLVTALPLLNMFLGWKTDVQERAEPVITETFRNNKDFAYQNSNTISEATIHFLNNSSGMLEIHRNSNVVDHEYAIQIDSVTSDASVNTLTFDFGDGYASPYETIDIKINGTYRGEEAATITIAYRYIGKDGSGIGGTQYTSRTIFFSNQAEDADVMEAASTAGNTTRNAYNKFIFTEDIYATVTSTAGSVSQGGRSDKSVQQYQAPAEKSAGEYIGPGADGCEGTSDDVYGDPVYYPYPDTDQYAKTYFGFNNQSESGWGSTGNSMLNTSGAASGKFFKGLDQYGPDYDYPDGVYAFPLCLVTYDNHQNLFYFTFIQYDDHGIYELYTANKENGYNANQGVDAATYNEYNAAWKEVVRLATYPLMTTLNEHDSTDYLSVITPQLDPAIERFEAAKEAYEEALAEAQSAGSSAAALPSYVQDLRDEIDNDYIVGSYTDGGYEINFQDVEFYEYFNYNDLKVEAENLYRTYLAPEVLDTYHIFRSGIREAELNFVIAGESNATKAEAIKASRRVHDQAAIDASVAAHEEWKQPVNTRLFVEDLTSRLAYYKQFVVDTDNREGNDHLYFLNQEIAHMDAQGLQEADYEAVSWARFANALEVAKAVADGNDDYKDFNSRIYDVKYNLMVAYKQLLKKADSLIEAGGTADLEANILIAEEILGKSIDELVLSDVALAKNLTKEQALGHLIEGLGYYYQARYSKHDIEVQDGKKNEGDLKYNDDGTPMMFNLYDESAYEYADNDRPNKTANQAKVDSVNANLEACIDYFVLEEPAVIYEVTYTDGVDGEEIFADQTYEVEEGLATPAFNGTPAREGYKFNGWTPYVNDTVTASVTYVAQWIALYTVTYTDGADGAVFANKEFTVEEGSATPAFDGSLEREGFEFTGWSPAVAATVTGNVTYVAQWEEIPTAQPELLLSEYGEEMGAVISTSYGTMDGFDGAVYGIDTLGTYSMESIEDYVTTPAGYIVVNTDNSSGVQTTGTVIELYDDDDNLVASYIFIYFGDVDMDGMVSSGDGTTIIDWEYNFEYPMEEYLNIAADVDGDGMVSSGDGTILVDFEYHFDPEVAGYKTQAEIADSYR